MGVPHLLPRARVRNSRCTVLRLEGREPGADRPGAGVSLVVRRTDAELYRHAGVQPVPDTRAPGPIRVQRDVPPGPSVGRPLELEVRDAGLIIVTIPHDLR